MTQLQQVSQMQDFIWFLISCCSSFIFALYMVYSVVHLLLWTFPEGLQAARKTGHSKLWYSKTQFPPSFAFHATNPWTPHIYTEQGHPTWWIHFLLQETDTSGHWACIDPTAIYGKDWCHDHSKAMKGLRCSVSGESASVLFLWYLFTLVMDTQWKCYHKFMYKD